MLQHGAYTLLMDSCYDREQFPTLEQAIEWVWASSKEEIEAIEFVLKKFFTLEDGVYTQKRIKEEIADYHSKGETNKRIALEREAKRRENNTNRARLVNGASPEKHEPPPNHKPLTRNQEPLTKVSKDTKGASASFVLPEWINNDHWKTWHSCPKRKKATNEQKQMAIDKLAKWREEGIDYAQALENAAIGGWQGLFEPKPTASKIADVARQTVPSSGEHEKTKESMAKTFEGAKPPSKEQLALLASIRGIK